MANTFTHVAVGEEELLGARLLGVMKIRGETCFVWLLKHSRGTIKYILSTALIGMAVDLLYLPKTSALEFIWPCTSIYRAVKQEMDE